jgi:hypothetical protein
MYGPNGEPYYLTTVPPARRAAPLSSLPVASDELPADAATLRKLGPGACVQ